MFQKFIQIKLFQVLTFDGKTFSLEASASKEELELFVSTPIPGIEYLKFETEVHAGKYTAELEYGKKGTPNYLVSNTTTIFLLRLKPKS